MICFSHIAWAPEEELSAVAFLLEHGVREIELAPRRALGDPMMAEEARVRAVAESYFERGIQIRSFQALLFGADGVELFGSADERARMKDFLIAVGKVAGWCGAGPMVFGSPKNRLKRDLTHAQAMQQAIPFFREIGDACAEAGSCLVMEANPESYGADFCTRLEQAAELVAGVDSPGFGLHLDVGGLALSGENFLPVIHQSASLIRHVHASQPNLASFSDPSPLHAIVAKTLSAIDYSGSISIEMRTQPEGFAAVAQAIRFVQNTYAASNVAEDAK